MSKKHKKNGHEHRWSRFDRLEDEDFVDRFEQLGDEDFDDYDDLDDDEGFDEYEDDDDDDEPLDLRRPTLRRRWDED